MDGRAAVARTTRPRLCECGREIKRKYARVCVSCRGARSSYYAISDVDRAFIYDRDGHQCLACGASNDLTIDHILPRALGGLDIRENYQTLCGPCNGAKGASYRNYLRTDGQMSLRLQADWHSRKTIKERIREKVVKEDGCWLWNAATVSTGNPVMKVDGRTTTTTRVAYEAYIGQIPPGQWVYRACGDSSCVAPRHLRLASPGSDVCGRQQKPSTHCMRGHELTEDNIRMDGNRRRCRTCRNEASLRYARRKKAQALAS